MDTIYVMKGIEVIVPEKPALTIIGKAKMVANAACNTYCAGRTKSFPAFSAFLCEKCPHNRRKSPR